MILQEFCTKKCYSPPSYVLVPNFDKTQFLYNVTVDNVHAMGSGRSKQEARHNAATNALQILTEKGLYNVDVDLSKKESLPSSTNGEKYTEAIDFIATLKTLCREGKWSFPKFTELGKKGPLQCSTFLVECEVKSNNTQGTLYTQGEASSKKEAKQLAARNMLRNMNSKAEIIYKSAAGLNNSKNSETTEFILNLRRIIQAKKLKPEIFERTFQTKREGLYYFFNLLDIEFKMERVQDYFPTVCGLFGTVPPFKMTATGKNYNEAEENLITHIYSHVNIYDLTETNRKQHK